MSSTHVPVLPFAVCLYANSTDGTKSNCFHLVVFYLTQDISKNTQWATLKPWIVTKGVFKLGSPLVLSEPKVDFIFVFAAVRIHIEPFCKRILIYKKMSHGWQSLFPLDRNDGLGQSTDLERKMMVLIQLQKPFKFSRSSFTGGSRPVLTKYQSLFGSRPRPLQKWVLV